MTVLNRSGKWWAGGQGHGGDDWRGGGGLQGALSSLGLLTLGCLSTLATNEIDPGALALTEVPPSGAGHKPNRG